MWTLKGVSDELVQLKNKPESLQTKIRGWVCMGSWEEQAVLGFRMLHFIPDFHYFCCCSVAKSHPTLLRPHGVQHARLPCPSPSPGVCPSSCPLSR